MTYSQAEKQIQKRGTKSANSGCLITVLDPRSAASEAYRALRTSLLYAQVDTPPKVILVTSPGTTEGKSTVCANLGVVLSQAGKRVLIADCDFRRPVMQDVFGLGDARGIVNVLAGECDLQEAYQEPLPDLKVLPVGTVPPNPAELLSSQRLAELLLTVREDFDYVLLDSSPTKFVSDPAILAAQSDGVLLTFAAQKTRKGDVRRAVHALTTVGANILGTVMNNVKGSDEVYY
ncbi:MAG TPA: CpsD/CapB family tyrosine-protein kinase [Rubrobacteraceae bacterium]|nr:CpsD/CapB family tyrosine-protein kinase [Rubrobacteraceae bacterium]